MESRDRFEGIVYFVKALDKFITIDYRATPAIDDLVMVEQLGAGRIAVERYSGQLYIGVARVLEFYQLRQSEQWNPVPVSPVPINRINQAPPPGAVAGKSKPRKREYMKSYALPLMFATVVAYASVAAPSATPAKLVPESITPAEAKNHAGEDKTVCGVVASANYAVRSRHQPTFLNLDEPYPDHVFTATIWIEDRPKFGTPETALKGKRICVSGLIDQYRGVPQIVLRDPSQLTEGRD